MKTIQTESITAAIKALAAPILICWVAIATGVMIYDVCAPRAAIASAEAAAPAEGCCASKTDSAPAGCNHGAGQSCPQHSK